MTTKEYLIQYKTLMMKAERYKERIQMVQSVLKGLEMDGMPKGTMTGNPTESTAINLYLLQQQYGMIIVEAEAVCAEITADIERMRDEKLRTLLYDRYILFHSWSQITEKMNQFRPWKEYEPKSVMGYLHKKALREFERVRK